MKKTDTGRFLSTYIFVFLFLLLFLSFLASLTGHYGFSLKILNYAYFVVWLGFAFYTYEIKKHKG